MVLRAIGPVWDGNEVWLLAAGGTLYFAFPLLYASSFSGFYLPLMMVLWLLMLRAIGIEFRAHIENPVWQGFFDVIFSVSSALLAIFLGAALGNVIRGVPLGPEGYFFEPLWTNFRLGDQPGILDWYTVLTGVVALVTLTVHGALYVAIKTRGSRQPSGARRCSCRWPVQFFLTCISLVATYFVRPEVMNNYKAYPIGLLVPDRCLRFTGRHHLGNSQRKRQPRLHRFESLHHRHAGRRGVCALSRRPAGTES